MADPLAGIDLDSLDQKYGAPASSSTASGTRPRITIYANPLKDVDLKSLDQKYGGDIEEPKPPVADAKPKEFWQDLNENSWKGTAQRTGVGILRGAKDVIDTGAHGLQNAAGYIADKVLPTEIAASIQQNIKDSQAQDKAGRDQFNKEYGDSTAADIGRVGGQVAATIPMMPARIMGGISAVAGALPTISATGAKVAAPLINRAIAGAGQGAVGGGIFGGATSSQNDNSIAQNVGEGVITGGLTGPLLPVAGDIGKAVGGKVLGSISNTTAQLAKRAEELGIPLKATQVSNSPLLKKFDQISGMLPFSGAQGISDKQTSAFTRAVARTFGENTDEITPKVVAAARQRIGQDIENVGKKATIKADAQLHNDLEQVITDAKGTMTDAELRPVAQNIQNIIDKISNAGTIDGEAYAALTAYKGVLSKAQSNSNPNIRNAANEIRSALDDALTRSISPDQKAALLKARGQYKAVMTIKDLAEADEHGNVSPLRLMQKVMTSPGGKLRSGELGEIADIGRAFFKQPNDSGTPLGAAIINNVLPVVHSPVSGAIAAGSALLGGATLGTVGEGALGLALNRAIRSGVNSDAARRALIRSGTGETHGAVNNIINNVLPYSAALPELTYQKYKAQK